MNISGLKFQVKVWDQWKPHVFDGLTPRRSLKLQRLTSEHQGTYSCEVSTPEDAYITQTDVIVAAGNRP